MHYVVEERKSVSAQTDMGEEPDDGRDPTYLSSSDGEKLK